MKFVNDILKEIIDQDYSRISNKIQNSLKQKEPSLASRKPSSELYCICMGYL